MNIIKDKWLSVIRKDGTDDCISIMELLDKHNTNPVIDIEVPRPDIRCGIFQFLIGVVQVAMIPKDNNEWATLWETPCTSEVFQKKLLQYENCFEIDGNNPKFMQDLETIKAKDVGVAALLINSPGAKTIKDNLDIFVKRDTITQINAYWAAMALYTLQTFAPAGGQGHRVGIRGGGPLTTIVLPIDNNETLWRKLWLNVLEETEIPTSMPLEKEHIFPWMTKTKTSEGGIATLSHEWHPLHMYFGMPRRIELCFSNYIGICDLTGINGPIVKSYKTKNFGINYDGAWIHPLNAYSHNPRKPDDLPLSIKGQPGGVSYRYWLGLVHQSETITPALVVQRHRDDEVRKCVLKDIGIRIWTAGYDMDNMKARCWYESMMPIFANDPKFNSKIQDTVELYISTAMDLSRELKKSIKATWFSKASEAKGDFSFIDTMFLQHTEHQFYQVLEKYTANVDDETVQQECAKIWYECLRIKTFHIFETVIGQDERANMKRMVVAKNNLAKNFKKVTKDLKKISVNNK